MAIDRGGTGGDGVDNPYDGDDGGGGSDGGGGGGITASAIFGAIPFLKSVVQSDFLRGLIERPRATILGVMFGWVVSKVLQTAAFGIDFIIELAELWGDALTTLYSAIASPFTATGVGMSSIAGTVQGVNESVASSFGLFSPAVLVFVLMVEVFAVLMVADFAIRAGLISVLGSLPVIGAVFNLAGRVYNTAKSVWARVYEVATP